MGEMDMPPLRGLLRSRKFWLAMVALVVVLLNDVLDVNLSTEALAAIVLPIVAAILGIAWEDAAEKGANRV